MVFVFYTHSSTTVSRRFPSTNLGEEPDGFLNKKILFLLLPKFRGGEPERSEGGGVCFPVSRSRLRPRLQPLAHPPSARSRRPRRTDKRRPGDAAPPSRTQLAPLAPKIKERSFLTSL